MRRVLADLDRTDLSTKAFCERRGLSRSLLSYWCKRSATSGGTGKAPFVGSSRAFVPVHVVDGGTGKGLIIELADGTRIHVPPGFDAPELQRLLRAVSSC